MPWPELPQNNPAEFNPESSFGDLEKKPNLNEGLNKFDIMYDKDCPPALKEGLQECKKDTNEDLTVLKEKVNLSMEERFTLEFKENIDESLGIPLKEALASFTIFNFAIWEHFDNFPSIFVEFSNYFWRDYIKVLGHIMFYFKINWMKPNDIYLFSFKNFKKISSIDESSSSRFDSFITWANLIVSISHSEAIHKNRHSDKIARYFPEFVKDKPYKK